MIVKWWWWWCCCLSSGYNGSDNDVSGDDGWQWDCSDDHVLVMVIMMDEIWVTMAIMVLKAMTMVVSKVKIIEMVNTFRWNCKLITIVKELKDNGIIS